VIFFEHKALYRRIKEDCRPRSSPFLSAKPAWPPGPRPQHHHLWRHGVGSARGRRNARRGRHRGRSDRSAHSAAARRETVCESVKKTAKVLLLHEDTRTAAWPASSPSPSRKPSSNTLTLLSSASPRRYSVPSASARRSLPSNAAKVIEKAAGCISIDVAVSPRLVGQVPTANSEPRA